MYRVIKAILSLGLAALVSYSLAQRYIFMLLPDLGVRQDKLIYAIGTLILGILFYFAFFEFAINSLKQFKRSKIAFIIVSNFILAILMTFATQMFQITASNTINLITFNGQCIFYIIILIALTCYLLFYGITPRENRPNIIWLLIYTLPCLAVWFIYLLAFYPGIMSSDSILQWSGIVTLKLDDWHPVFHTMFLWLITRVWYSPAAISIVQIILMAFGVSSALYQIHKMGFPKVLLLVTSLIYALNPVYGIMTISIWKDLPYSIALLWVTVLILKLYNSKGEWLKSIPNQVILAFTLVCAALFRHNGLVPAFLTAIMIVLFYLKYWRRTIPVLLILALAVFLIKVPLYDMKGVKGVRSTQYLVLPLLQVSAIVHYNGEITEDEKAVLNKIMPLSDWGSGYYRYNILKLTTKKTYSDSRLHKNESEFVRTWLSMVERNPEIAFRAYSYRTSIIWSVFPPQDSYLYTNDMGIFKNNFGLAMTPVSTDLHDALVLIIKATQSIAINWIFWRPAIYMYGIIFCGFVLLAKNKARLTLLTIPAIGNILGLLIVTVSPSSRYLYVSLIMLPLILLVSIMKDNIVKQEGF